MSRSTLHFIRFFAPAVIFLVLSYATAKVLKLTTEDVPVSINDLGYNLSYLIFATVYQFLPLRRWAYDPFLDDIDERIRARMVLIAGLIDDKARFSRKRMMNVFYNLVDNDKSLEKRSEDIMFNGALLTSLADLTAISALFLVGSLLAIASGLESGGAEASRVIMLLCGLFLISLLMQDLAKRHHIKMGIDQLDYIEQQFQSQVTEKLTKFHA